MCNRIQACMCLSLTEYRRGTVKKNPDKWRVEEHFILAFAAAFLVIPLMFTQAILFVSPNKPVPSFAEAACVGLGVVILCEILILGERVRSLMLHHHIPTDNEDEE